MRRPSVRPAVPGRGAASGSRPLPLARSPGLVLVSLSLLSLPFLSTSCRVVQEARERSPETRGEDLLICGDYEGAMTAFQRMAESTQSPAERGKAQLGIGRACIKLGSYRKGLDALYSARRLCEMGPLRQTCERLIGEASFANRDYAVARPYLERSLVTAAGEERSILLVELHVCAARTSDSRAADRYLAEAQKPLCAVAREILRDHLEPALHPAGPLPPSLASRSAGPPPASAAAPEPAEPAEPRGGPVKVIPRGWWNPRPVKANVDPMGKISCLTIHHTGGPTFWGRSAEEAADEIRKIQRVHQNENRWADIGYHYIIDRMGRVWQGRPLSLQGAHAHGDANRGNIGVVVLGNYLRQEITAEQLRSLRSLVGKLCATYQIPSSQIYTHAEIRQGYTDCPGPAITRVVEQIRRRL
jgi:tetratricopeptide (TPR) repeat protein